MRARREAVQAGLLGAVGGIDFRSSFDHRWIVGKPVDETYHCLLYDFGMHRFDMAACLLGDRPVHSVRAAVAGLGYQRARPPARSRPSFVGSGSSMGFKGPRPNG